MKIACVDKTAADRIALQKYVDEAYEHCRAAVGHLSLLHAVPASREEISFACCYEAVLIGPGFPVDEAAGAAREIRSAAPSLPIMFLLQAPAYSLRNLRRLQEFSADVFAAHEPPVRFVHRLSLIEKSSLTRSGKLVLVSGVKGGVGTTSIAAALAHAAEAAGKTAVVVDLSPSAALVQYMGSPRRHSPEYAAALTDRIAPDRRLVERCLAKAPNGIHLFLPPAGGSDIRETWVRNGGTFELSLSCYEMLQEAFDLVLVDTGGTEGILPFALLSRADFKLLVSSNDPASVHLLSAAITRIADAPGSGVTGIGLNMLVERGLTKDDILDFLYSNDSFDEGMLSLEPLPYSSRGKDWIGTGNTLFTESGPAVQEVLERWANQLSGQGAASAVQSRLSLFARFVRRRRIDPPPAVGALPYFPRSGERQRRPLHRSPSNERGFHGAPFSCSPDVPAEQDAGG